jgi:hypothetical protein
MSELADDQTIENDVGGISPAEIPAEQSSGTAERVIPEKTEKLSLRDQLNKSVETVRTEEAKRVRDAATGKFTKSDASAAIEKPAAAEIPKPEQNAQPEASKTDGPPSAWAKIWEGLTPEARAIAVKRETEVAKGFEEYRGKTAQLQEISQALEPLKPMLQQQGIQNEAQAVKRLLEWEGSFRNPQTRMQAFQNLAQQYGVDLSTLVQNPSQAHQTAQDIPEPLRPVIDQFGNIVQEVNGLKQEFQRSREERISNELTAFAKDKPHFEKVRVIMGQLMTSGIVQPGDLEGAYQKATSLHPEVSAAIRAEETAKAAAELAKTNAEKAARARAAAVSPSQRSPNGASNGAAGKPRSSSVRESLNNAIGELREGQRA